MRRESCVIDILDWQSGLDDDVLDRAIPRAESSHWLSYSPQGALNTDVRRQKTHTSGARPLNILVVEDNPADIRLLRMALNETARAFSLKIALTGQEALDHLYPEMPAEPVRFDLIILDLNLPGMGGHALLERIRKHPATNIVPVVVMSSSLRPSDIELAYSLRANCYIVKPVDLDEFMHVVSALQSFWFQTVCLPTSGLSH